MKSPQHPAKMSLKGRMEKKPLLPSYTNMW